MLLVGLRAALSHLSWKEQLRRLMLNMQTDEQTKADGGQGGIKWGEGWGPWWLPPPIVDKALSGIILSVGLLY